MTHPLMDLHPRAKAVAKYASMPKNVYGFPDLSGPVNWAEINPTRCMICHPSPTPWFPDCAHGHFLDCGRVDAQIKWDRIRLGLGRVSMFMLAFICFSWAALFVYPILVPLFFIYIFQYVRHQDKKRRVYRFMAAHPEANGIIWEKRQTARLGSNPRGINEPWVKKIF